MDKLNLGLGDLGKIGAFDEVARKLNSLDSIAHAMTAQRRIFYKNLCFENSWITLAEPYLFKFITLNFYLNPNLNPL